MKTITFGATAIILAACIGMVQFGSPTTFARSTAVAQAGNSQHSHQAQISGNSSANAALYSQSQVFLGTISKDNGHYVLTAGYFTYKLDDQSKVKQYDGEQVQITGKLNPKTNKIHIIRIRKPSY